MGYSTFLKFSTSKNEFFLAKEGFAKSLSEAIDVNPLIRSQFSDFASDKIFKCLTFFNGKKINTSKPLRRMLGE